MYVVVTSQGRTADQWVDQTRRSLACSQTLYFLLIILPRFIFYYARSTDFGPPVQRASRGGGLKKGKEK